jgi:hypothetical protein
MWSNGLLQAYSPGMVLWTWLTKFIWQFFVYVSLFGFVAQFVFRYLVLIK